MTEILFKLRLETCPSCGKNMMQKAPYGVFPYYRDIGQEAQMKQKEIAFISRSAIDEKKICSECESSGKASFVCCLCSKRKPSTKIQESFGDPAEHLCKDCHETVPAKEWEDKQSELERQHRYDFE